MGDGGAPLTDRRWVTKLFQSTPERMRVSLVRHRSYLNAEPSARGNLRSLRRTNTQWSHPARLRRLGSGMLRLLIRWRRRKIGAGPRRLAEPRHLCRALRAESRNGRRRRRRRSRPIIHRRSTDTPWKRQGEIDFPAEICPDEVSDSNSNNHQQKQAE